MKSLIYKNPVKSAVLINILALLSGFYIIKHAIIPLMIIFIAIGILNRRIVDNGLCMDTKKKYIIFGSCIVMVGVLLLYAKSVYLM